MLKIVTLYFALILGWTLVVPSAYGWYCNYQNMFTDMYSDSPMSKVVLVIFMFVVFLVALGCFVVVRIYKPKWVIARMFIYPNIAAFLTSLL